MLWFRQAACLDQLWRALPNASRRLRSRLRRCDTSFLNTPALPLLPVAPDLRRLSRQLNQCQPPQNPNLLRVGEIEGAHARHDATPSRSAKDPGLGSGTSEIFMNSQAERGGAQVLLPLDHPASSLSLFPSRLPLGAEESEFMDPHGPTIVPRCPTAVIADKIKHIHFQKESKNIFLPTWQAIPARGYVNVGNDYGKTRLYTAIRSKTTALLRCAHHHSTQRERLSPPCRDDESVVKRSHRNRSSSPDESGFYSRYFLVPKKDGGLRLILDLRLLNYALMKRLFRMITLKQILPQICPGDWFMSLDLKDAYFHIQVAPYHRQFLIFAFEGVAYQYKVLPFGLSMAPRTFTDDAWSFVTRCMDAALSPLRQMGIRILNYLDDWLIQAQSQAVLTSHKTLLLSHLDCLGLRVNFAKSILSPSQRVSFLGTVIDCADDSNCFSGASRDNSAPCGLLQGRYRPSAQSFPENAGPYGSGFAGTQIGSASHATHPLLADAEGSIRGLASQTPPRNSDSGLCISPGPLGGPLLDKARHDPRHGAPKEGCHDRRFQQRLGRAVRGQTDLRPLVRRGVGPAH